MKFCTEYLTFNTKKRREYIHITPQVEAVVAKSGVQEVPAAGTVGLQPLGSTKSSFTAPGCDVDSQCAWYKISVRSVLLRQPESRFGRGDCERLQLHLFRHIPAEVESGRIVICNQDHKRVTGTLVSVRPGHGSRAFPHRV